MSEKEINLEADTEFRFEIENKNETVQLTLKSGTAEIFGTELVRGKPYKFTNGAKIAVFTWQGCVLEYQAKKNNTSYVSKETPMMFYLNCHCCLEQLRQKAEQNSTRGPVTMVVGPADVGKSTLCRILLNYAVRMGGLSRRPIFVDVDVSQGHISIPGTIGAMVVERPASVEEGFLPIAPLVYNFGHLNILDNPVVFNLLVSRMAEVVHERMKNNKRVNASGIIINTYGWTKGKGYQHLAHVAQAFEVDIILVLDQERLYNELVRDMPSFVKVTLLPKSGGVVERNRNTRSELRETAISEYFYGTPQMQLHPHSFDVKFSDVNIIRIGVPVLPDSCLPIGMKADDCHTKVTTVQPGISILHHILALSFVNPSSNATQDAIQSNVAGFVCVTNVDADRQTLTLLSPQPKPLPPAYLILSEIQFVDSH